MPRMQSSGTVAIPALSLSLNPGPITGYASTSTLVLIDFEIPKPLEKIEELL